MKIMNRAYFLLFMLLTFVVSCTTSTKLGSQKSYHNLTDCIDAHMKWNFQTKECTDGKRWINASETLLSQINKPLNDAELQIAKEKMKVFSSKTIAQKNAPQAIIMMGAPGSGKTTISKTLKNWLPDFNLDHYVQFDGDFLRESHQGLKYASRDPNIGYINAWPTLKPYIGGIKAGILDQIIAERRNVIIPTGLHGQKYFKRMLKSGYEITVIGIYVDPKTSYYRGKNRAEWTGRVYTGSQKHWKTSKKDMHKLATHSKTKHAFIIDNTDFNNPKVMFRKF